MNYSRPKNLNLFTIHFPVPAIISILHRISGFALFLIIPLLLWGLSYSLTDDGFDTLHTWFSSFYGKFFLWILLIPFFFHLVAGIRHLLMDINVGDTLNGGRATSWATFIITSILVILSGVWLLW